MTGGLKVELINLGFFGGGGGEERGVLSSHLKFDVLWKED